MNRPWTRITTVFHTLTVIAIAGTLNACGQASAPAVDTAAEAAKIMALESEWSDRFAQGDIDYIVDLHAANGIQMPPGAEAAVGSEALRAAWQGMYDTEGLSVSWESSAAFVSASGDMAWDHGKASLTSPDGTTTPMKYLVVWTRVGDEWKVAADMFNANE